MDEFLDIFLLSFGAMILAMLMMRVAGSSSGYGHSFGSVGREFLVLGGIALVQVALILAILHFFKEVETGYAFLMVYVVMLPRAFKKTRPFAPDPRDGYAFTEPYLFTLLTLVSMVLLSDVVRRL